MHNPFQEKIDGHENDVDYIQRALKGDAAALEALILRHQSWIFNIALNMTGDIHRAEDVTQEILIIIISKLATYEQKKASFRTWLYRIVANHVINMKQSRKEQFYAAHSEDFDFNSFILNLPENQKPVSPDDKEIIDETGRYLAFAVACMTSVLNPEVICLGGGVIENVDGLITSITKNVEGGVPYMPKIVASPLGKNAVILGTVNLVLAEEMDFTMLKNFV